MDCAFAPARCWTSRTVRALKCSTRRKPYPHPMRALRKKLVGMNTARVKRHPQIAHAFPCLPQPLELACTTLASSLHPCSLVHVWWATPLVQVQGMDDRSSEFSCRASASSFQAVAQTAPLQSLEPLAPRCGGEIAISVWGSGCGAATPRNRPNDGMTYDIASPLHIIWHCR